MTASVDLRRSSVALLSQSSCRAWRCKPSVGTPPRPGRGRPRAVLCGARNSSSGFAWSGEASGPRSISRRSRAHSAWTIGTERKPISRSAIGSIVGEENLFLTRLRVVARRRGTAADPIDPSPARGTIRPKPERAGRDSSSAGRSAVLPGSWAASGDFPWRPKRRRRSFGSARSLICA